MDILLIGAAFGMICGLLAFASVAAVEWVAAGGPTSLWKGWVALLRGKAFERM